MRRPLVAGNWKMHGSRASIAALLDELVKANPPGCAVCPPFPFLAQVAERLRGSRIAWGAQNASEHAQGAHTGEVSAAMLAEFGCRYVIVGHSERRHVYGESDARITATIEKTRAAMKERGKTYEPVIYDGAGHGFMRTGEDPEGPHADIQAREEAWARWKELLQGPASESSELGGD